jgi:hypothetical protein
MSMPPPGGWQPPQQPGPPHNPDQPYGQPGFNPQQPAPSWQQGEWPQQSGPAPEGANGLKWLLGSVAVLLVIGISVGATLIFMRDSGGGGTATPTAGVPGDIASVTDTGPVAIITEEPTCKALDGINSALADVQANGWSAQRSALGPAAEWTEQQRAEVQAVATAIKNASDKMVPLARQTPHRVVRELYEQFIAYGRAYADSIASYQPTDDALASTNVSIGSALLGICNAIEFGSARRSLAVEPAVPPTAGHDSADPSQPQRFVASNDSTCVAWTTREDQFIADTTAWANLDTKLTASEWTPEQRAIQQSVLPVLATMADDMESAGKASGNPVLEDFAVLGSLYFHAYVSAGDDYAGADSWLSYIGSRLNNSIASACGAAGS